MPVLQLPYHENLSIDYETLSREIDWNFDHGVTGVVLALASEIFRLTDTERDELAERTVGFTKERGPVIISVGAESSFQAVRHAQTAERAGADAVMASPPVMTRCPADQIGAYYEELLGAISLPVIIQDASGYVGAALSIQSQADLFASAPDRIMFKPEAQPLGPTISALAEATDRRSRIFEGSGGLALVESFIRGVSGTMPGGEWPWAMTDLWNSLTTGDMDRARAIHSPLAGIVSMLHNLDSFIAIEKMLLCEQGIFKNTLIRGPVGYRLDETSRNQVLHLFRELEEICGKGSSE
jgi:dihydrodipicolinate synthase/N-acetylneuraminate lyase